MNRLLTGTLNAPRCRRSKYERPLFFAVSLLLLARPGAGAVNGSHDTEFEKYPLDKWVSETSQARLRWRVEIPQPELSTHQRLMLRVVTHVDGREIEKRRGGGNLMTLLQVRDTQGHIWQNHEVLDLSRAPRNAQSSEFTLTYFAFVLPGDYSVTVALCNPATLEHSVIGRKVHVAPLRAEPLPGAWTGIPPVEFIQSPEGPPDIWYLPEIQEHLQVALRPAHPVHLQVLVNTTPSERAAASVSTMRRNMSVAIPALKIFSQLDAPGSTLDAVLLDLMHRRIPFEQTDVQVLDWARMRNYFLSLQPGLVDVATLQGQWKMRRFFLEEVTRRLTQKSEAVPVVIILSGPAFFENPEAMATMAMEPEAGRRLFYIRYRTPSVRIQRVRVRPGMRPPVPLPALDPMPLDDLERTLEPFGARIFDATSAEQFRRVLAAILEQISKI
jgi:hypothetical protein